MRKLAALFVFLGLLCGEAHATCSAGSLPFNLTNGTTADASQVMANYNAIIASVNATCAGSGANSDITSLLGLTTALTAAQGGTNTWVANAASGGSANAQTVTTSTPTTSFTLTKGYSVTFLPGFTNTGTMTLAVNGTTATAVCMRQGNGFCNGLSGNELNPNVWVTVTYDGVNYELVSNQFQPGWGMTFTGSGSGNLIANSTVNPARGCDEAVNIRLSVSVASNNLSISLLNNSGGALSTASPALVCFPDNSGNTIWEVATSAVTLAINSGSTLGSTNGVSYRYWIVALQNGSAINLGIFQSVGSFAAGAQQLFPLPEINLVSTVACNACGTATAAGTFYSTVGLSNVPFRILGYFEANEATAGTWASAPNIVRVFTPGMKKTGDTVQCAHSLSAGGNPSINITPTSAVNMILVSADFQGNTSGAAGSSIQLSAKRGAATLQTWAFNTAGVNFAGIIAITPFLDSPQANTSINYTSTPSTSAGVLTNNQSDMTVCEIMSSNDNLPPLRRLTG